MKTLIISTVGLFAGFSTLVAEEAQTLLRDGLFAEEAKEDHKTAILKYETLLAKFEKDRSIAVVALYRLAEIHRKQGKKKQAAVLYFRLIKEFPNMEPHITMSKWNLTTLGEKVTTGTQSLVDEEAKQFILLKKQHEENILLFLEPENLKKAALLNSQRMIDYLLSNGVPAEKSQALAIAADKGHLAICKLLLNAGCDINFGLNVNAIKFAFTKNHADIVKLLLERGAKVSGKEGNWIPIAVQKKTPLSLIKLVVKAGYDINTISTDLKQENVIIGGGLLHKSILLLREDLFYYLIKNKVDLNTGYRASALHIAANLGMTEIISTLIKEGADLNVRFKIKNKNPKSRNLYIGTPLESLILGAGSVKSMEKYSIDNSGGYYIKSLACAKLLIEAKASMSERSFFTAISYDYRELVKLILENKADTSVKFISQQSLLVAINSNNSYMTELLIKHGVDLQKRSLYYAKQDLRIELTRKYLYPKYFKRKGITITIPQALFENNFIKSARDSTTVIKALNKVLIPAEYANYNRKLFSVVTTKHKTQLWDMDQVEFRIFRNGKQIRLDLSAKNLPQLKDGDVIELSELSRTKTDRKKPQTNAKNEIPISSAAFAPLIEKHLKLENK